jgi:hypothetical protein
MPSIENVRRTKLAVLTMLAVLPAVSPAAQVQGDGFATAAKQVTQLFWLAETANVCQWASADDTAQFKVLSVRFVSAHLSEGSQRALLSMVAENGYEQKVRLAALEGAAHYCKSNPLQLAWSSYQHAAQERAFEF